MKYTLIIFFLTTFCNATVYFTWDNTIPSYSFMGENMQDCSYGWYGEIVEYKGQYEFPHQGNVLGSGYIGPAEAAPVRILSIEAEVAAGTKVYMRIFGGPNKGYSHTNLGPISGEPYYTVMQYTVAQFESIQAYMTVRITQHGVWYPLTTTYVIHKGQHEFGDIITSSTYEIYPMMTSNTTNGWEIRSNLDLYPIPSNNYVFVGWTNDVTGMKIPFSIDDYEWHGKTIGALFTEIPTNFNIKCNVSNFSNETYCLLDFQTKQKFKYQIEYTDKISTNTQWQTVSTNIVATRTNTTWLDTTSNTAISRYYRIIQSIP